LASKKGDRKPTPKKTHGLSKAEKIAIPIIIIIAVWALYSFTQPSSSSTNLHVTYSSTASLTQSAGSPDFTLPVVGPNGLTGQKMTLSSFRGKVVLLEFMEPWCPHCQNMASVLDGLYKQYGSGNVVFISVAGPWNDATANDAANFINNYGTGWTYVYDSSGIVFSNYGVDSTPTFFIIGKDGSISSTFSGEQTANALSGAISAAISS
jgi:thiol-disulfide isomerase/thioredoxin